MHSRLFPSFSMASPPVGHWFCLSCMVSLYFCFPRLVELSVCLCLFGSDSVFDSLTRIFHLSLQIPFLSLLFLALCLCRSLFSLDRLFGFSPSSSSSSTFASSIYCVISTLYLFLLLSPIISFHLCLSLSLSVSHSLYSYLSVSVLIPCTSTSL